MKFGEQLKSARERQGLSLSELAARTKIRTDYLEALETGDFARLPERPYARAFLQRYALELDVEAAPLLADFDRLVPMSAPVAASLRGARPARRGGPLLPAGLIASLLSGLVLLGALVWGGYAYYRSEHGSGTAPPPEPTRVPLASSRQVNLSVVSRPAGAKVYLDNVYLGATPIDRFPVDARDGAELRLELSGYVPLRQRVALNADRSLQAQLNKAAPPPLAATSTAGASAGSPSTLSATPATSTAGTSSAAVSAATSPSGGVTLRFVGRSWVRVLDKSGKTLYEGIPEPGSQQSYPSGVSVRVGSAGAVQVSVAGQPAQVFGPAGQPLTRAF